MVSAVIAQVVILDIGSMATESYNQATRLTAESPAEKIER